MRLESIQALCVSIVLVVAAQPAAASGDRPLGPVPAFPSAGHGADQDLAAVLSAWELRRAERLSLQVRSRLLSEALAAEARIDKRTSLSRERIRSGVLEALEAYLEGELHRREVTELGVLIAERLGFAPLKIRSHNKYGRLSTASSVENALVYLGNDLLGEAGPTYVHLAGTYQGRITALGQPLCERTVEIRVEVTADLAC